MNARDGNGAEAQQVTLAESGLEDLVVALLQQRPIVSVSGKEFILAQQNERRLFAYYARNRELWPRAKPVLANEIEQLLAALKNDRLDHSPKNLLRPIRKRRWRLRRIEAHRFGGLHRHCGSKGEPPDNFVLEIDRDVTLVGGFNGAGKTALQNVIIWCLTGKALRSQHMPDDVHEPMDVLWSQSEDEDDQKSIPSSLALPPIVPLPSAADLEMLSDKPKIDTWAELTFQDEEAGDICAVRRALTVTERGKIGMTVTGRQDLGLSDLAIEAGTLMFGVAANSVSPTKQAGSRSLAALF